MSQETAPLGLLGWPALAGMSLTATPKIELERGVWGKVHGAASDYRWIAATPGFLPLTDRLVAELNLGSEDSPSREVAWRTLGDLHLAVCSYPSRAVDAAGRKATIEKQVMAWRRPAELPAILGAFALLPAVATASDSLWWDHSGDARWAESDFVLPLDATAKPPILIQESRLAEAVERGIQALLAALGSDSLARLYGCLLAGQRGLFLEPRSAEPLAPEALAALLLPLPRELADGLSLAGGIPSQRFDPASLAARWAVLATHGPAARLAPPLPPLPTPDPGGARLVQALELRQPAFLGPPGPSAGLNGDGSLPLCLWGTTSAGKTVLIAQLFLEFQAKKADWEILPTERSLAFSDIMRNEIRLQNRFPAPTPQGVHEIIAYQFRHQRSGREATLAVEDRAGEDYRQLTDGARERLSSAAGLMLLFDTGGSAAALEADIWRTLDQLHVASGRGASKDSRPIAVCVSKADLVLRNAADRKRAIQTPDSFARERLSKKLLSLLDSRLEHYRLFPVSSAGVRLRWGSLEPVVFLDESLTPRLCPGGEPFNLSAPFLWLLDELTGTP